MIRPVSDYRVSPVSFRGRRPPNVRFSAKQAEPYVANHGLMALPSDFLHHRINGTLASKRAIVSKPQPLTFPKASLDEVLQMKQQTPVRRIFLMSDNADRTLAPFQEAVMIASSHANSPYGNDLYTKRVEQILNQQLVGRDDIENVHWLPVGSGAGANKVAMSVFVGPTERAVCADTAHALFLEANAFAISTHTVPLTLKTMDGKIYMPRDDKGNFDMKNLYKKIFLHTWDDKLDPNLSMVANPSVLYITQPTEYGTLYSMEQIRALTDFGHRFGMVVYMDGARLWNAAAAMGYQSISDYIVDTGVDAVSLNGTKNGMMFMDGLLIIRRSKGVMARKFPDHDKFMSVALKKRRQLAERPAKEAIQSAQMLVALSKAENGREYAIEIADRANQSAAYLERKLADLGVAMPLASRDAGKRSYGQGTNMIYLDLPKPVQQKLAEKYDFFEFPIMNIDLNQDGILDASHEEKLWKLPRLAVGPSVSQVQLDQFVADIEKQMRVWQASRN